MVASRMELVLYEEVGGGEDLGVKERKLERKKTFVELRAAWDGCN